MGVACLNQVCSDGTRVLANNGRYNTARQGKLKELEAQIDQQIAELLKSAEEEDRKDQQLFGTQATPGKLPVNLRNAKQRKATLQEAKAQLDQMQEKRGSRKDVSAKGPQIPLSARLWFFYTVGCGSAGCHRVGYFGDHAFSIKIYCNNFSTGSYEKYLRNTGRIIILYGMAADSAG